MAERLCPHQYCLQYAVGCLPQHHQEGKVTAEDYHALLCIARERGKPPVELMLRCFPRLYKNLGHAPTLRKAQRYWRITHQSPNENTPVSRATVKALAHSDENGDWWHVRFFDWKTGRMKNGVACNTCRLPIEEGHLVYVHSGTIAEFAPVEE